MFDSVFRELVSLEGLARPPRVVVATGCDQDDEGVRKVYRELCAQGMRSGSQQWPPTLVVLRGDTGKRAAIAEGLREITATDPHRDGVVILMDGDTMIQPGLLRKMLPLFRLKPEVSAVITNEDGWVKGPRWFAEWISLRFGLRHRLMCSVSLSGRLLCLTGRFSVFRTSVATDPTFLRQIEPHSIQHWLWDSFDMLSGDDKSTWYWLAARGCRMLYVPDAMVRTLEVIQGSAVQRALANVRRWSGNNRGPARQRVSASVSRWVALIVTEMILGLEPGQAAVIRWTKSSNRIYVSGSGFVTLTEVKAAQGEAPLEQVAPGVWHLRANLIVEDGAHLVLNGTAIGGDVDQLRLQSNNSADTNRFVFVKADWGSIGIRRTSVTSWDDAVNGPDTEYATYGRAYIAVRSRLADDGTTPMQSRMDIIDSEIGYLGYDNPEGNGLFTNAFFYTGLDGSMVFPCPVTGGTTAGSVFPRCELREMLDPEDENVNWTLYGTHTLEAQCRVTQVPSTRRTFIAQIHGFSETADPLFKLRLDNHTVEALVKDSVNSTNDISFALATVDLGDMIAYQIKMENGQLSVTVNGASQSVNVFQLDPAWTNQTFYFKAGNYCQDNAGLPDEGAVVSFYHLNVNHSHE